VQSTAAYLGGESYLYQRYFLVYSLGVIEYYY